MVSGPVGTGPLMIERRRITDPADELFDVLDENGGLTGQVKRRADVHRDGDWHRAFHLWLFARDLSGEDIVLFQRRSDGKDTWPNRLDVAVGGHFRAGETLEDVVREVNEEIGIQPEFGDLTYVGRRRALNDGPDWHDRELQDIYALAFPAGFPEFFPNATELAGLVSLRIDDLFRLFDDHSSAVPANIASLDADDKLGPWRRGEVQFSDFVPVRDRYWIRGVRAGQALLAGEEVISLD